MRSNVLLSKSDMRKMSMEVAREELARQKNEICPACEQSIGNQVTAVLLKVLHDQYGFGKRKMQNVMDYANGIFDLCRRDGDRFQATQCVEWLKSIGIDLEEQK